MSRLIKDENVYNRDESSIKIMPAWMIYSMPLVLVVMVVSFIVTIVNFGTVIGWIFLGVFTLSLIWSIISDKIFSLYENCRISFKKDSIIYEYELNKSVMPSSNVTTTVTIKDISKVKVRGKSVVIKGSILRRAPLKKPVEVRKVELPIDFKEREAIIEKLKERIK